MADKRLKEKKALVARLQTSLAEITTYVDKNRDLYTKKKNKLAALIRQRQATGMDVPSSDEVKLRKQCKQYEDKLPAYLFYVEELEKQKSNLAAMKRRRKAKKESISEKDVIKFVDELGQQLGYTSDSPKPKRAKKFVHKRSQKTVKPDESVVEMWREKREVDVISARSKQASAKRRLASQLNTFNRCPYCETKLSFDQSHVDHIHPLARGGLSEEYNLVLVCAPCNTSKGMKTLRAFCRDTNLNYDVVVARLEMIGKAV